MSELEEMNRAKKGSMLIKKVKSTNYEVLNVLAVNMRDTIGIKTDGEFNEIKASELPIMDLLSTGSTICKTALEDTFKVAEVRECKLELNDNSDNKVVAKDEGEVETEETTKSEELTIDDFIDDFKL